MSILIPARPAPPECTAFDLAPPYTAQGALAATMHRTWSRNPEALADWERRFFHRLLTHFPPYTEPQIRLAEHILARLEKLDPDCRVEATIILTEPHAGGPQ